MKCGSCRDTKAKSYAQVEENNNLFEILKKLNPNRTYNPNYSYFCGVCIDSATVKLSRKLTEISDQNANSFTTITETTATNDSDSSKDSFDQLVVSKSGNLHHAT